MARLIKVSGETIEVKPANGKHFSLKELQDYVGGYIEVIDLRNGEILVINEEGKLNGFRHNMEATCIAANYNVIYDWDNIVGDVVMCKKREMK